MTATGKWVIDVKGEAGKGNFEISVLREDHRNRDSYGWLNLHDKFMVLSSGAICHWPVLPFVWERALVTAQELADMLNARDLGTCH